jgi:hypothetical protein
MRAAVEGIAVDLSCDLELLSRISQDLAQRIPECRPMVDVLACLDTEWGAIAAEVCATKGELWWWSKKLDPARVNALQARACELVDSLARERDETLPLVEAAVWRDSGTVWRRDFNRACTRSLARNFHLTHCRAEALHLAFAQLSAVDVDKTVFNLHLDRRLVGDLANNSELRPADSLPQDEVGVQPGKQALRLVEVVLRVLPPNHRSRYGEEFRAELYGLVEMNRSYGAQLLYVLRLFNRVFDLRYELGRPSRRSVRE